MTGRWAAVALILLALQGRAAAGAAPAELRGKSVLINWSESRVQRFTDEAGFSSVMIRHELQVYVSATGRVFNRQTNTNSRGASGSTSQIAGQGRGRTPGFAGQMMTIVGTGAKGGARSVVVSFDAGFGSCRAEVIRAKQDGASTMRSSSKIQIGRTVEIKSATASAASCSVRAGNVFGTE
jgi:hypothetical protein